MTVSELIDLLEDCDPDAEVFLMSQPSWPFEHTVAGVTVRSEIEDRDEDGADDEEEDAPPAREDGTRPNDVFILEGTQLRYGSRDAWAAAAR
jgi:hypothetical protein